MRQLTAFLMRSSWHTFISVGVLGVLALIIPPFAFLSSAVLALVTLRKGGGVGTKIAILVSIVVAIVWVIMDAEPGLTFPLVFLLWPPILVASEILRRTEAQGMALVVVGLTIVVYHLTIHTAVGDVAAFWQDWLKRAIAAMPGAFPPPPYLEKKEDFRLVNGFLGILYGLNIILALLLGRWLQSLHYHPGAFAPEFSRLRLPRLVLLITVAIIWAMSAWDVLLGADVFMVANLMYFFVGLAVLHGVIAVRKWSSNWITLLYATLVFIPQFTLVGLAIIGAIDTFIDFRNQRGPTG